MVRKNTKRKNNYYLSHQDLRLKEKKQSMRTPPSAKIPIPVRDEVTEERDVATYPEFDEWAARVVRTREIVDSGPPQRSEINLVPLDEAQARFPGLADGLDDETPGSDPGEFFLILPGRGNRLIRGRSQVLQGRMPIKNLLPGLLRARTKNIAPD
jgi:hypothetical protein